MEASRNGTAAAPLTVVVADDHPLYREALARAIGDRDGLELAGQAESGKEALERIRALRPAVALLDVKMPDLDGLQILAAIQDEGLPTRVVVVSGHLEDDLVYRAVSAGASAYLPKTTRAAQICDAIEAVGRGETILPPEVQSSLVSVMRSRAAEERPTLTAREREVLRLAAEGEPTAAIAARLEVSAGTVKTHLRHLYEKLGVSDRAAAVAEAMRRGLLD